jgi:opacity protein-like surface antigen
MKTLWTGCIFAAVVCAAPAFAADKPVKVVAPTPAKVAVVPAYSWTGVYFGLDTGWQRSRIHIENPTAASSAARTFEHTSAVFSAHGGFQHQLGHLVLGLEGGWTFAFGNSSTQTCGSVPVFTPGGTTNCQAKLTDIGNVGPRLGIAFGTVMPYITGGYARGHYQFNANATTGAGALVEQGEAWLRGWYFGGGVEMAFAQHAGWVAGVDYRHYSFTAGSVNATNPAGVTQEVVRFHPTTDIITARLSYKFKVL